MSSTSTHRRRAARRLLAWSGSWSWRSSLTAALLALIGMIVGTSTWPSFLASCAAAASMDVRPPATADGDFDDDDNDSSPPPPPPPPLDGGRGKEDSIDLRTTTETTTTTRTTTLAKRPNIIFILTDDQDVTANSLEYMPNLNQLLRSEGTEFVNFFVPTGLCCPSRSTILRGQYCHNTEMYDNGDLNNSTYLSGGFDKFAHGDGGGDGDGESSPPLERTTVATMLSALGYDTALVGKYINGYEDDVANHVPPGWSHWMGMTRAYYYGPHFSNRGELLVTKKDVYQTDFIRDEVHRFLTGRGRRSGRGRSKTKPKGDDYDEGSKQDEGDDSDERRPFFLYVAPFAPHAPAIPAKRHANMFDDLRAPRNPSFNPPSDDDDPDGGIQSQKPSWIGSLPPLTPRQIDDLDEFYRNRLRSLQAVDEMLLNVTSTLRELGLDDDTYVFYMGDNGQHLGDFRMPPGKRQAYDTDVRVPFLVRGPGVEGGGVVTEMVQSVDLLPTWMSLAFRGFAEDSVDDDDDHGGGGTVEAARPRGRAMEEADVKVKGEALIPDGKSIVPLLNGIIPPTPTTNVFRSAALLEMYGGSSITGRRYQGMPLWWGNHFWNNTYRAVRVINGTGWARNANLLYVEWCTGERELYDCHSDPHQVRNRIDDPPDYYGGDEDDSHNGTSTTTSILDSLSLLVSKLGDCAGGDCHRRVDYDSLREEARELRRSRRHRSSSSSSLRCFNPPHLPGGGGGGVVVDPSSAAAAAASPTPPLRRRPWAVDEYVPEPFVHGFPFSDGDVVSPDLLEEWEGRYFSYFY